MLELSEAELGHGSYTLSQGNSTTSARKRAKSKNSDGGERKRKKNASASVATASSSGEMARDLNIQDFGMEHPTGSGTVMQGRTPKLVFKKAGRKGLDKGLLSLEDSVDGQKRLGQKPGSMDHVEGSGLDNMGLLQNAGGNKQGMTTSSNYDDAMQFVKKRRYLHAVNSDYGASSLHMTSQVNSVMQGSLGPEPTLAMLDSSPLKHDKSGIPDEVLQSLLDHYSHKPDGTQHHDVTFDLSDHPHHVDLQPAAPVTPELEDDSPNGGDKTAVMSEYSKFLLQALERTSHSGPFPSLGPTGPFPLLSSSSSPTGPLFSDKHVYASSPLDCGFPPAVSSPLPIVAPSSTSSSSSAKSHYGLLVSSPSQAGYHISLESTSHQQLTPSQELTEQLEKQHSPGAFTLPPQDLTASAESSKGQQPKAGGPTAPTNGSSYPDLSPLNPTKETTYQIENFAQAFGSQFKSGRRTPLSYGSDPGSEVDHRIRTPVSEFSGYTSLLADVSEPVSTGSKTPTSQSYR